jgi:hypothetical protein
MSKGEQRCGWLTLHKIKNSKIKDLRKNRPKFLVFWLSKI